MEMQDVCFGCEVVQEKIFSLLTALLSECLGFLQGKKVMRLLQIEFGL